MVTADGSVLDHVDPAKVLLIAGITAAAAAGTFRHTNLGHQKLSVPRALMMVCPVPQHL